MNDQELFSRWRQFIDRRSREERGNLNENQDNVIADEKAVKEAILQVLPHADVRLIRIVSSSETNLEQYVIQTIAKHGAPPDDNPDIDIQVEVAGISREDIRLWNESNEALVLRSQFNYDIRLRAVDASEQPRIMKLRIFDFDDTLARTKETVKIRDRHDPENVIKTLSTQEEIDEYSQLSDEAKEQFLTDFKEFNTVNDPQEIETITKILKDVVQAERVDPQRIIMVLTARAQAAESGIELFLKTIGISTDNVEIVGVGDRALEPNEEYTDTEKRENELPAEERKVNKVRELLQNNPFVKEVLFFDDSHLNLAAMQKLNDEEYPEVKFILKKITHTPGGLRVSRLKESAREGEIQRKYAKQWQKALSVLDMGGNKHVETGMSRRQGKKRESSPPGMAESVEKSDASRTIIAIFGASGCGKSRMKQAFVNMGFGEVKSFTTRGPRGGSEQDIEYDFTSLSDFLSELQAGELVNVNQYNSEWYGTRLSAFENSEGPKDLVLLTDITSLHDFFDAVDDSKKKIMFVHCASPPLKELIRRHRARLESGEYKNREEFEQRLTAAVSETKNMEDQVESLKNSLPIFSFEEAKKELGL